MPPNIVINIINLIAIEAFVQVQANKKWSRLPGPFFLFPVVSLSYFPLPFYIVGGLETHIIETHIHWTFLPIIFVISIFELTKTVGSAFKVPGVGLIGLLVRIPPRPGFFPSPKM